MRTAVIGAGAWGTALADLLARNGHQVALWAYERDVVDAINRERENTTFLPGSRLAEGIVATSSLEEATANAGLLVLATPSHHLRRVTAGMRGVPAGAIVAVATKGIERGTLSLMTDIADELLPGHPIVAVSGPSFAAEVAQGQPTAIVAASRDVVAAQRVQEALSGRSFRVYTHDDVIGVELGGALKNVMAVATGIAEGAGLGFNSRAALITRGLAEMTRLGVALGAQPLTFLGLAGVGDLVLTCTGALSRNRALGVEIGEGAVLAEALEGKQTVAEGVNTTESAHELAIRTGVEMPIVGMVHRILFGGQSAAQAVAELMARELRAEQDA